MRKKNIKYIPIARFISKEEKKPDRILDDIIKIVGVISGGTAIFAALLYIFGRNYAAGYFGAMNVPSYMLDFTLGEYGAVAWFPMIFIFVISIITLLFFPIIDIIVLPLLERIIGLFPKRNQIKKNKNKDFIREKIDSILYILYGIMIVIFCFSLYQSLVVTSRMGVTAGDSYLQKNANVVEFHTTDQIAGDGVEIGNQYGNNNHYYIYSGFRLITKNEGRYYLFKDLDPETCKPAQVYIIDESKIDQVILSPAEDISDQCNDPVNP